MNVMLMKSISSKKKILFSLIYIHSYWEQKSEYTPESRIETHEAMKKKREKESKEFLFKKKKKELFHSLFIFLKNKN